MPTLPPDTFKFRAPTFDAAVGLANAELGEHLEVVEANRIRRGGLGGFFATDLGVEIVVRPASPAAPEPLPELDGGSPIDRLLALVDAQERADRQPAAPTDFAAALERELGVPAASPQQSSADWSVEAYRRLGIPARAPAGAADLPTDTGPEPAIERPAAPRPRRHAGRELAVRVCQAAQAAAEHETDADDAFSFVTAESRRPRPAREPEPTPAAAQTMDLVTQAATALFGQLGNLPVVPGTQAAHVRKLTVSVTSPLGKVIEISAELGA